MAAATLALRAAIHAALLSDTALRAALGGPRIYDTLPREAAFPYVLLGDTRLSDASGDAAPLQEHLLTLHAWSRQGGHSEAHSIAAILQQALHDAALNLVGHRLVNLRTTSADIRREAGGRTYHALVRFRAVTETD